MWPIVQCCSILRKRIKYVVFYIIFTEIKYFVQFLSWSKKFRHIFSSLKYIFSEYIKTGLIWSLSHKNENRLLSFSNILYRFTIYYLLPSSHATLFETVNHFYNLLSILDIFSWCYISIIF